ncbi:MAG: hypothetical protein ACFCAD_25520 [Pleurocapsa sp.]
MITIRNDQESADIPLILSHYLSPNCETHPDILAQLRGYIFLQIIQL